MSANETPMFATGQKDGFSRAGRQSATNAKPQGKLEVDDLMETSEGPHYPSYRLLWNCP
jgi:hypothetical protein